MEALACCLRLWQTGQGLHRWRAVEAVECCLCLGWAAEAPAYYCTKIAVQQQQLDQLRLKERKVMAGLAFVDRDVHRDARHPDAQGRWWAASSSIILSVHLVGMNPSSYAIEIATEKADTVSSLKGAITLHIGPCIYGVLYSVLLHLFARAFITMGLQ